MSDRPSIRRCLWFLVLAMLILTATTRDVRAQGFLGASAGYAFGGDAGCPEITDCEEKNWNYSFSGGALGPVVGFETEILFAKDFFGESSQQSGNVTTFTGNFMLAPRIWAVQPYGLIGVGLIRTSAEGAGILEEATNQFGWDVGGGLLVFFGETFGIRGEVRYYHSFEVFDLFGIDLSLDEKKLDFGRVSGGVVFKF